MLSGGAADAMPAEIQIGRVRATAAATAFVLDCVKMHHHESGRRCVRRLRRRERRRISGWDCWRRVGSNERYYAIIDS